MIGGMIWTERVSPKTALTPAGMSRYWMSLPAIVLVILHRIYWLVVSELFEYTV